MAKRKIKPSFDPDNLTPFQLPRTMLNSLSEMSRDGSFVLAIKDEQNEIQVVESFTNRTDYLAFMVHLGVHTNANLGARAQEIGDDIIDGIGGEFDGEE